MINILVFADSSDESPVFSHQATRALASVVDGLLIIRTVEKSGAHHEYCWPAGRWGNYQLGDPEDE